GVDELGAPKSGHAENERVIIRQRALAHQTVSNWNTQMIDERAQLLSCLCQNAAATDVDQGLPGLRQRAYDCGRGVGIQVRPRQRFRIQAQAVETFDVNLAREYIHRHVYEYRSWLTALRQLERLFDDFRKQFGTLDSPGALHEGAVDFELRRIAMEIHFLVRVFAIEMAWNVAGDHHHRNAVECGVRH